MPRNTDFVSSRIPFPELALERGPSFVRNNINAPIENFLSFFKGRTGDAYCSGSFGFDPNLQYDFKGSGPPSMFNRPLEFYYSTLCNFCYALPHAAKWAVFIEPHNQDYLLSQLNDVKKYEPTQSSQDWNLEEASKYLLRGEAQETIGCIFALGVQEAGFGFNVGQFGGVNGANNGFMKAPVTQGANENQALEITVKETNCSYTDFFLHPWAKLMAHKGLFATSRERSLKADITIFELAGTFPNQDPIVRKIFKYYDAVPSNISSENLNYESDRVMQRQIQFVYNYYTVQDGSGFGVEENAELRDPNFNSEILNEK